MKEHPPVCGGVFVYSSHLGGIYDCKATNRILMGGGRPLAERPPCFLLVASQPYGCAFCTAIWISFKLLPLNSSILLDYLQKTKKIKSDYFCFFSNITVVFSYDSNTHSIHIPHLLGHKIEQFRKKFGTRN